jgi:glycerol-3-phosphate acyltransferase PlsY
MNTVIVFISLLIAYLLGSINPAYFLGKYLKHIDIRKLGTKNAGTMNAAKVLGKVPAIFIAIFDLSKGILAISIAYLLRVPIFFIYLAGFVAILGHIFPFYLKFRGGQGAATATGLLLAFGSIILIQGRLPLIILGLMVIYTAIISFIVRKEELIAVFVLPFILFWLTYYNFQKIDLLILSVSLIIIFLFSLNIYNLIHNKSLLVIKPEVKKEFARWRVFLRPAAIIFPLLYLYLDKKTVLIVIGILSLFFLALDISRLSVNKFNELLYKSVVEIFKSKEHKKFSSITLFMVASFLTILLFDKNIAIPALFFLTLSDLASKFFGLQFGRIKFFNKSLEGSLAYFLVSFLLGILLSNFLDISLLIIFLGSIAATLAEFLPLGVDDNFTVPLISATVMWITKVF